jgi:hypothetical protein
MMVFGYPMLILHRIQCIGILAGLIVLPHSTRQQVRVGYVP